MTDRPAASPSWDQARLRLIEREPGLYELEPGGPLALELAAEDWILEITPDGRLVCQAGMVMDDIRSLLSEGTPEDLNNDELAKQAKYYLQPKAAKVRRTFLAAGFEETTEMNEAYVAVTFHRTVDFGELDEVARLIRWCRDQFARVA